jgi:predicted Fe-S protein YdhL (DUF1289 family)
MEHLLQVLLTFFKQKKKGKRFRNKPQVMCVEILLGSMHKFQILFRQCLIGLAGLLRQIFCELFCQAKQMEIGLWKEVAEEKKRLILMILEKKKYPKKKMAQKKKIYTKTVAK